MAHPISPAASGRALEYALATVAVVAATLAFYLTLALEGAFWWSDAPRHGLNGIFLKDVLVELPLKNPKQFAINWYSQYPALTFLFYPPLFYVVSAPAFLLFGESHAIAQAMVLLHLFALGLGMVALSRFWLPPYAALAAALIFLGLPETGLWGRQVMLEIPGMCWIVWAAVFGVAHARHGLTVTFAAASACLLGALYTKISMVFAAPALAVMLLRGRGMGMLTERRTWFVAAIFLVSLIPLVALTVVFGQANVQSVVEIADTAASRRNLAGWVWYLRVLPGMATLPVLLLAAIGFVASFAGRIGAWARGERTMLLVWFLSAYLALSFIELKEARHGGILLVPIAIWAASGLSWLLGLATVTRPLAPVLAAAVAAAFVPLSLFINPVPRVDGYREAARQAAAFAAPDSAVLFSGYRDGSFVFNMRTSSQRPDLVTIRADKLFLSVSVRRELGVRQRDDSEEEIVRRIRALGVSVVVAQRDFWTDLETMARLQRVFDGSSFEEVGRIQVSANVPVEDRELRIYRLKGDVLPRPASMVIDLPIIGRRIEGKVSR